VAFSAVALLKLNVALVLVAGLGFALASALWQRER